MARFVLLLLLLALLVGAPPLRADEADVTRAEEAVQAATEQVEQLRLDLAALYKEIEHDFELLRSERWAALSAPYHDAIARQLTAEPESDPAPALVKEFAEIGLLSTVVSERLAAAVAQGLTAKDGPPLPASAFADAVKVVFPEETFVGCWENAFLDLPAVVKFRVDHDKLAAAERKLARAQAESGEKPEVPHGMVLVPRGRFIYGPWKGWDGDLKANKESRGRVDAFFIDVHEVTNESYLEFLKSVADPAKQQEYLALGFEVAEDGTVTAQEGRELWPVRGVDFAAALAYAESVGKRLPSEEEWEKAARGEKEILYPWGNEPDPAAANAPDEGNRRPAPVGSYPKDKSPYGVMDMAGNVSELTATFLERRPYKGKHESSDSIVYRGGNFLKDSTATVTGYRYFMTATSQKEEVGFRCVISEKAWKRQNR